MAEKNEFTPGEVARICKVAPRTVNKWFDAGRLQGYRLPGNQNRRIPREALIRFLNEHGMPLGELEDGAAVPDAEDTTPPDTDAIRPADEGVLEGEG